MAKQHAVMTRLHCYSSVYFIGQDCYQKYTYTYIPVGGPIKDTIGRGALHNIKILALY